MIVPQYWAEGRAQHKERGRQITARRFGWSDVGQAEAQAMADQRVQEALRRLVTGEKLQRREPKIPYNGAEGVPIREEILSRHGEVIITRNSYGAHCLNTPNVLFADVDFQTDPGCRMGTIITLSLAALALIYGVAAHGVKIGALIMVAALFVGPFLSIFVYRTWKAAAGGSPKISQRRITSFAARHPDWHLRIYRTPAGFRVLIMHRTFSPDEPAVAEFFNALGTDRVYVRMCKNQHCFRARLTAKPWRAGMSAHMKPHPGTWPVRAESMPKREAWVREYEVMARQYSSCQFIESLGSSTVDPQAQAVQELHDKESRATSALPMG
jgi:hypothetical protein